MVGSIKILLFDVDGVIVDPIAYRLGVIKTLELLCNQFGLTNADQLLPAQAEIAYMESRGIHDVWDITNIMFSSILAGIYSHFKQKQEMIKLSGMSLTEKIASIRAAFPYSQRPDYAGLSDQLVKNHDLTHPPDVALKILSERIGDPLSQSDFLDWFDLFKNFLIGTRSAYESYGTRLFQNIILGSDEFEKTYALTSEYDGPSLLRTQDKVMISSSSVTRLAQLNSHDDYKLAIYTARPSHPFPSALQSGYSPEAEIALQSAGIKDIPLVGMGAMEWLAKSHAERPEDLTKPNTTQAFAALISAVARTNDIQVLEEAYKLDKLGGHPDQTILNQLKLKDVIVYVFEDTISGIKPILAVAEKLNASNYSISVKPLGIAQDKNKKTALEQFCAEVFPDINCALQYSLF